MRATITKHLATLFRQVADRLDPPKPFSGVSEATFTNKGYWSYPESTNWSYPEQGIVFPSKNVP